MSGEKKLLQQPFVVVVKHVPNSGRVSAEKEAENRKEAAKLAAEKKQTLVIIAGAVLFGLKINF